MIVWKSCLVMDMRIEGEVFEEQEFEEQYQDQACEQG